jgi:nicotinamide mononucleotide transporter
LAFALLWGAIYFVLVNFTPSTVPLADAFTTALSIVALWMMARKYAEQWLVWAVVDAVSVGLYIYKDIPFYALLYTIYTVLAFVGYKKWLRLMAAQ